jgi:crotonobetainyl-CoA:carnitine CoA-transferase CaiB-like acyl-CoA transferase
MAMHEGLPLVGIQVVDFGQYIAGPLTARLLADAGATVTKIDPPDGPRWKSNANHLLNRGKKSLRIDLKSDAGREQAWQLVRSADVVIENFSPGVMHRLSLSAEAVRAANPRCIYVSMPGFRSSDRTKAELKAFEAIIMTECGVFADMGLNRTLMGKNPSYSPLPLASTYACPLAASAIAAALIAREVTGLGDQIEVPLAACLHDTLIYNAMDVKMPARYHCQREREITRRQESGLPMNLTYDQVKDLLDPFFCTYECKDGRMFYLVAPCHATHHERTLKILGLWDEGLWPRTSRDHVKQSGKTVAPGAKASG